MGTAAKRDHTFAKLEDAADHAHLSSFEKAHVGGAARSKIVSALGSCVKAATDLERFLSNAATHARRREVHDVLDGVAEHVGDLPSALAAALHSVDSRAHDQRTVRGTLHCALRDAKLAFDPEDETLLAEAEKELLHAIAVYDEALGKLSRTPGAFVDLVVGQRRMLSHLYALLHSSERFPSGETP